MNKHEISPLIGQNQRGLLPMHEFNLSLGVSSNFDGYSSSKFQNRLFTPDLIENRIGHNKKLTALKLARINHDNAEIVGVSPLKNKLPVAEKSDKKIKKDLSLPKYKEKDNNFLLSDKKASRSNSYGKLSKVKKNIVELPFEPIESESNSSEKYKSIMASSIQHEISSSDFNYNYTSDQKEKLLFSKKAATVNSGSFMEKVAVSVVENVLKNKEKRIDIIDKISTLYEKIKKRRSKVQALDFRERKIKEGIFQLGSMTKIFSEDFFKRFIMMPEIEEAALKNYFELETCVMQLIKTFHLEEKKVNEEFKNLEEEHRKSLSKIEDLKENHRRDRLLWYETQNETKEKQLALLETNKIKEGKQTLQFENAKLEAKILNLLDKIDQLQNDHNVQIIRSELESYRKSSMEEMETLRQNILNRDKVLAHNKMLLGNYKTVTQKMQKEINDLIQEKDSRRQLLQSIDKNIMKLEESRNRYRETALMQLEDYDTLKSRWLTSFLLEQKLEEKCIQLQTKIDKMTIERIEDIENPEEKQYSSDRNFFVIVREQFNNKNIFTKKVESEFRGIDKEMVTKNLAKLKEIMDREQEEEAENMKDERRSSTKLAERKKAKEKVPKTERNLIDKQMSKLQIFRPNFFTLIHHRYNSYKSEVRPNRDKRLSTLFLATLRGILDSKNNEFSIYDDVKKYSKFVDFVYSWLGKYAICDKNRHIKQLEATIRSIEDIRLGFLDDLMNPKIEKLWECETFREFLVEKYNTEEIYFYCRCREYLFDGPQLAHFNATFDIIHYVDLEKAETMLDYVFFQYEAECVSFIKSRFKEKSKQKTFGKKFIDSAFVLRVCLEFYHMECWKRYNIFREVFLSLPSFKIDDRHTSITFENFRIIFDNNFQRVTDLEKSELFRECFSLGKGAISADVMYTVLNDSNFFIKFMRVKSFMPIPLKLDKKKMIDKNQFLGFDINRLLEFPNVNYLNEKSISLGNERFQMEIGNYVKIIKDKIQVDSSLIRETSLCAFYINFLQRFFTLLRLITANDSEYSRSEFERLMKYNIGIFEFFKKISEDFKDYEKNLDRERLMATKRVQRFFKKKLKGWYSVLTKITNPKPIKAVLNKSESLRKKDSLKIK